MDSDGSGHRRGRGLRRARHSSLARTAACAAAATSTAARARGSRRTGSIGRGRRLLIWTVAGRRMAAGCVYPAAKAGVVSLWLHDLRTGEARALPGTDGACAAVLVSRRVEDRLLRRRTASRRSISASGTIVGPRRAPSAARRRVERVGRSRLRAVANGGLDAARCGADRSRRSRRSIRPAAKRRTPGRRSCPTASTSIFLVSASQPSRVGIWIASLDDPASATPAGRIGRAGDRRRITRCSTFSDLVADGAATRSGHLRTDRPVHAGRPAMSDAARSGNSSRPHPTTC